MQRFGIALIVILSFIFSTKLSAQKPSGGNITGDIKGIVYDADTTKPLLGANITLFSQSDMKAVGVLLAVKTAHSMSKKLLRQI